MTTLPKHDVTEFDEMHRLYVVLHVLYVYLPIASDFAQSQSKYSIGPLEIDSPYVEITLKRVEMEVIVFYSPRVIVRQWVDNDSISTQIRNVRKRIFAVVWRHIYHLWATNIQNNTWKQRIEVKNMPD